MKALPRWPPEGQAIATAAPGIAVYDIERLGGDTLDTLDTLSTGRRVVRIGPTVYVLSLPGALPTTSPLRA